MFKLKSMKDTIQNLYKEQSKLVDKQSKISDAITPLKRLYDNGEMPSHVEETIDMLKLEYDQITAQIKAYSNGIKAFQDACTHKHEDGSKAMVYDGHDSHKTYYKCTICGYEDDY